MSLPHVAIVILNWNGWRDTCECLESLFKIEYSPYTIFLIDNASSDESLHKIGEYLEGKIILKSDKINGDPSEMFDDYVVYETKEIENSIMYQQAYRESDDTPKKILYLIKNKKNYGFAEGNNIGIRFAHKIIDPDYILLLNNDTIVDQNFLGELIHVCEDDPEIGFAGPKTYFYNFHGKRNVIDFAGGRIILSLGLTTHIGKNRIDKGQFNELRDVDYIEGSCLLARKKTINEIGLLDPHFFLYWEETDWCLRARRAGYKLMYVPSATIWHKGAEEKYNKTKSYFLTKNRFKIMKKHARKPEILIFLMFFFLCYFWFFSFKLILNKYHHNYPDFIHGIIDGMADLFSP